MLVFVALFVDLWYVCWRRELIHMKKPIIAGIAVIACVALCAAVLPRSAEVEELPAEPLKAAVSTEIEARSEETPHVFISANVPTPVTEVVTESNFPETEIIAEKETPCSSPLVSDGFSQCT